MMLGKKSTKEKKRKTSNRDSSEGDRKRRNTDSSVEDAKEEGVEETGEEPSDVEEGGLDLSMPFRPISAYVGERQEMLEQCFRVLGDNKLKKMLPDELKDCSLEEIKGLCWEQLQQLSQDSLLEILEGREVSGNVENKMKKDITDSQQDNNVDSTSSLKEPEDSKEGASGEESDVLSINADDSDIEGHKDDKTQETPMAEEASSVSTAAAPETPAPPPKASQPAEPKAELQHDIDKSVSEILALAAPSPPPLPPPSSDVVPRGVVEEMAPTSSPSTSAPAVVQPSAQQLELLELEMRARAIKALMKANEATKHTSA